MRRDRAWARGRSSGPHHWGVQAKADGWTQHPGHPVRHRVTGPAVSTPHCCQHTSFSALEIRHSAMQRSPSQGTLRSWHTDALPVSTRRPHHTPSLRMQGQAKHARPPQCSQDAGRPSSRQGRPFPEAEGLRKPIRTGSRGRRSRRHSISRGEWAARTQAQPQEPPDLAPGARTPERHQQGARLEQTRLGHARLAEAPGQHRHSQKGRH